MTDSRTDVMWCAGGHDEPGAHRSAVTEVPPECAEDAAVRVWLGSLPGGGDAPVWPHIALEFEDSLMRRRWLLRLPQARLVLDTLLLLRRIRSAADLERPNDGRHPGWCVRTEETGGPHRSPRQFASSPTDDQGISMYLVQAVRAHDGHPSVVTRFEIIADEGNTFAWSVDAGQHERLEGALTHRLDQWALIGADPHPPRAGHPPAER